LINAFRVSLQPFATAKCGQFCFLFPQQKAFAALQGFLTPPKGDFPRGLATKGASLHLDARGDANRSVHRHMATYGIVRERCGNLASLKILDETQRRAVFRRNFLAPVVACFSIWDLCLWVDDGGRLDGFSLFFLCFKCFLAAKKIQKDWGSVTKSSWFERLSCFSQDADNDAQLKKYHHLFLQDLFF
jgi:hypothetical protein